jgi:hypothetical protein
MLVPIYQIILSHIQEHAYLNTLYCENLKPHKERNVWYLHITLRILVTTFKLIMNMYIEHLSALPENSVTDV